MKEINFFKFNEYYEFGFLFGFLSFLDWGFLKLVCFLGCFFSKQCCLLRGEKNKEVPQSTKIEVLI